MTEATCMLCDATTPWPCPSTWGFPYVYGRVWRLCAACWGSDYLERLRALSEARAAAETGAKGRRKR